MTQEIEITDFPLEEIKLYGSVVYEDQHVLIQRRPDGSKSILDKRCLVRTDMFLPPWNPFEWIEKIEGRLLQDLSLPCSSGKNKE